MVDPMTSPTPAREPSAEALVDDLFTNGNGDKADRLVLWRDTVPEIRYGASCTLGGWSRGPVLDRVEAALRQSRADAYERAAQLVDADPEQPRLVAAAIRAMAAEERA